LLSIVNCTAAVDRPLAVAASVTDTRIMDGSMSGRDANRSAAVTAGIRT
jgi:hypothetical protein